MDISFGRGYGDLDCIFKFFTLVISVYTQIIVKDSCVRSCSPFMIIINERDLYSVLWKFFIHKDRMILFYVSLRNCPLCFWSRSEDTGNNLKIFIIIKWNHTRYIPSTTSKSSVTKKDPLTGTHKVKVSRSRLLHYCYYYYCCCCGCRYVWVKCPHPSPTRTHDRFLETRS